MTLDKYVTFVYVPEGNYNPVTSKYEEPQPTEVEVPCNVSEVSLEVTKELFGVLDTNIIKVRLISPYNSEFSYILYQNSRYDLVSSKLNKIFYLKEVKDG